MRPIPTNPRSMEVGQYGLMRVTCFLACRLELDAVAGLRWISWCVLGWGTDFSVFFFRFLFFSQCTRPVASMRPSLASFTSLLVTRPFLALRGKSLLIPGCLEGAIISFVCLSTCVFVVFSDCESCTRPISTNPGSMEAEQYGPTGGTCFLPCRLELDAVVGPLWISWCLLGGADFFLFFFD